MPQPQGNNKDHVVPDAVMSASSFAELLQVKEAGSPVTLYTIWLGGHSQHVPLLVHQRGLRGGTLR